MMTTTTTVVAEAYILDFSEIERTKSATVSGRKWIKGLLRARAPPRDGSRAEVKHIITHTFHASVHKKKKSTHLYVLRIHYHVRAHTRA